MTKKGKWILGTLAVVSMFVFTYGATLYVADRWGRPYPEIPGTHRLVAESLFGCEQPFFPEAYTRGYASPLHPEVISIVVYGLVALDESEAGFVVRYEPPIIWIFYEDDGVDYPFVFSTHRIITLPDVAPEYVSVEELKERYPRGPCS